jgi:hypothetical protein
MPKENLAAKPEVNKPLENLRSRREDNIKTDLRDRFRGCGLDSSVSVQGSVAGSCKDGNEP